MRGEGVGCAESAPQRAPARPGDPTAWSKARKTFPLAPFRHPTWASRLSDAPWTWRNTKRLQPHQHMFSTGGFPRCHQRWSSFVRLSPCRIALPSLVMPKLNSSPPKRGPSTPSVSQVGCALVCSLQRLWSLFLAVQTDRCVSHPYKNPLEPLWMGPPCYPVSRRVFRVPSLGAKQTFHGMQRLHRVLSSRVCRSSGAKFGDLAPIGHLRSSQALLSRHRSPIRATALLPKHTVPHARAHHPPRHPRVLAQK